MKIRLALLFLFMAAFQPTHGASIRRRETQNEVYNGVAAAAGEFPAFTSLCFNGSTSCFQCGGFLATENHVVTAGHCLFQDVSVTGVRVNNTLSRTDGIYREVTKIVVHPEYLSNESPFTLVNDVAVLTLDSPVTGITPYSYNRDGAYTTTEGISVTAIGFGRYGTTSPLSEYLRKTTLFTQRDSACASRLTGGVYFADEMMCTYLPTSGVCAGDSGGPVLDSSNLVLGLQSFGSIDCAEDSPDYWADIWNYAEWIDMQIAPTAAPTTSSAPSESSSPSEAPSPLPTRQPTRSPTPQPTRSPTLAPTTQSTPAPTAVRTLAPTPAPTSCFDSWCTTILRWMGFVDENN